MYENEFQGLSSEQVVFICWLALSKIRTDIAFLKCKVDREDSLRSVNRTASQIIDCGILQGLINAEKTFSDVFNSGVWKSVGGSDND